jgi:hypothetical protein
MEARKTEITADVVDFICKTTYQAIPPEVIHMGNGAS